jgi:NAD(P)-dependent dehydrogenase (short-subunit alcohol dehydrogenase family)
LINNAGIFAAHSVDDLDMRIWQSHFQVNFFAAVTLTNHLVPLLKAQKGSSIVNVSSTLGLKSTAETSAYSASKAAMISWTQSLALGLAPFHIRANVVCPGIVETPIHGFAQMPEHERERRVQQLDTAQPLGRVGQPEDIAKALYFLASDDSAWTTGACLSVDGGINIV